MAINPLAVMFGLMSLFGLFVALVGHASVASCVAPSMARNSLSFPGYLAFVVCGLLALAAAGGH